MNGVKEDLKFEIQLWTCVPIHTFLNPSSFPHFKLPSPPNEIPQKVFPLYFTNYPFRNHFMQ